MIVVYANHGQAEKSMLMFERMRSEASHYFFSGDGVKSISTKLHRALDDIAFGFLNTPHGTMFWVVKNLRLCRNYHNALSYIWYKESP